MMYNLMIKIKSNKSKILFVLVKLSCFIILLYNALILFIDYLSFPYTFTLTYETNKVNPEIPVINICTESHVLFNYEKAIDFHDLNEEIIDFKRNLINDSLILMKCIKMYIYKV